MPHLVIARSVSAEPMGAQSYQAHVASRAAAALADASGPGESWRVDDVSVSSLRSPLAADRRLPMGRLLKASPRLRRLAGRAVYRRGAVVHRMNLELPPAPVDVITLHDLVAWQYPDEAPPVPAAAAEARAAAAVVCVSQYTAAEAVEALGIEAPHVVPNGVDPAFFDAEPLEADELARLGVEGTYVLTAGGASERKNLDTLAAAWPLVRRARPDVTLVLAGPPHPRRTELFAGVDGVRLVGRVAADVLPRLYAGAAAVAVPSRHEGFGLPALEAMAAGVPVVAADRAALPEVVGDAGILVEPERGPLAEALVDVLDQVRGGGAEVADLVARARRRARGFTWERSAAGHAAVWRSVAD